LSYNQRTFTRIDVDFSVTVIPEGGALFEAKVMDISAGGLRIEYHGDIPLGTGVECSFIGDTHTLIDVRGVVCFTDLEGFGVRLTGYDTVSCMYLKGLLMSIADDPHALEDEILLNLDELPQGD
jgi:hypothetical protein